MRPILVLGLPEAVRKKLQSLGYEYVEDIERALPTADGQLKALIEKYNLTDRMSPPCNIITVASLLESERASPPIGVFHQGLDKLLGGGLPLGRITELCGPPGSGKTQMCLQFCADVQVPTTLGGSGAQALYITTDFGFSVERLKEILQATVKHCFSVDFPTENEKSAVLKDFTVENLLNGVKVLQTYELKTLLDALRNLKNILETNRKVKLLVVDSFSLPLVVEVDDFLVRSKIIAEMLDLILDNAVEYKLAVVVTNQLQTIITQKRAMLKPSLGEGFGHRVHQRLLLDERKIYLTKSINRAQCFTRFEITKNGIR